MAAVYEMIVRAAQTDATVLLHFGWHWYLKGGDIFLGTVAELRS